MSEIESQTSQLDDNEVSERYFRPVEGRYLDQALDRALYFLSQGLTERAIIMLEVLCRLEPENPRVTLSYVEALIEEGVAHGESLRMPAEVRLNRRCAGLMASPTRPKARWKVRLPR